MVWPWRKKVVICCWTNIFCVQMILLILSTTPVHVLPKVNGENKFNGNLLPWWLRTKHMRNFLKTTRPKSSFYTLWNIGQVLRLPSKIYEYTFFATRTQLIILLLTNENFFHLSTRVDFNLQSVLECRFPELFLQVRKRVGFRTGVHCPQLCPECPWNRCCPRRKECKVSIESTLRLHCRSLQCHIVVVCTYL